MIETLFNNGPLLVYVALLHLVISFLAVAWSLERKRRRNAEEYAKFFRHLKRRHTDTEVFE